MQQIFWATAQSSLSNKETIQALRLWDDESDCMPKAIVGDEGFFQEDFLTYYRTHGISKGMSLWFKNPLAKQS